MDSKDINCTPTNDSLELTWKPPTKANGVILRYTVTYQQTEVLQGHDDLSTKQQNFSSEAGSIVGLWPYRKFNITIFASTGVGPGPASDELECETAIGGNLSIDLIRI